MIRVLGSVFILVLLGVTSFGQTKRTIAVTIDDLPVVSIDRSEANTKRITKEILAHIKKHKIPAIGFVNENKLFDGKKRNEFQIGLLKMWVDAGLELGNHTYFHKSLHKVPFEEYKEQVVNGDKITKELLGNVGKKSVYFRHPYLNTGMSLGIKKQLDELLAELNYTIAPVTIDNSDWAYASAYDKTKKKKQFDLRKKIGANYVKYLEQKTEYWERQSVKFLGREPSQILLLHANSINADFLGDVAKMYKKRGYEFVTLEQALEDPVYRRPERFTGRAGISWLHRWILDEDRSALLKDEPAVPSFVMKAAGLKSE